MELRSFNVENVYAECVKCTIGEDIGVDKRMLFHHRGNIRGMLSQISEKDATAVFNECHKRKDGEEWTPYLQIVRMLILLGKKLNYVSFEGKLAPDTVIKFNL